MALFLTEIATLSSGLFMTISVWHYFNQMKTSSHCRLLCTGNVIHWDLCRQQNVSGMAWSSRGSPVIWSWDSRGTDTVSPSDHTLIHVHVPYPIMDPTPGLSLIAPWIHPCIYLITTNVHTLTLLWPTFCYCTWGNALKSKTCSHPIFFGGRSRNIVLL